MLKQTETFKLVVNHEEMMLIRLAIDTLLNDTTSFEMIKKGLSQSEKIKLESMALTLKGN